MALSGELPLEWSPAKATTEYTNPNADHQKPSMPEAAPCLINLYRKVKYGSERRLKSLTNIGNILWVHRMNPACLAPAKLLAHDSQNARLKVNALRPLKWIRSVEAASMSTLSLLKCPLRAPSPLLGVFASLCTVCIILADTHLLPSKVGEAQNQCAFKQTGPQPLLEHPSCPCQCSALGPTPRSAPS